jgi:hypothetical protein
MRLHTLLLTLLPAGAALFLGWGLHEQSVYAASQKSAVALADFDPQANDLLAKMTLDEKIGQMTQADQ